MNRAVTFVVATLWAVVIASLAITSGVQNRNDNNSDSTPVHLGGDSIYPDLKRTPGEINPDITQETVGATICNLNWSTKSIRPSSSYTNRLKRQQIEEWNLPDTDPAHYEEDHLIPLELGGHPTSPKNLWPEPYHPKPGANEKDKVENQLHREVCDSDITLERAQKIVVDDWYACYLEIERHNLCL